jgi:hypothetical protein
MKATVVEWTQIQNKTNDDAQGNALYDKIEHRTFGKRWQQEVAIALTKREQELVDEAKAKVEASA